MRKTRAQFIRCALVCLFISVSIAFQLLVTLLIFAQPEFPLNIGVVRTTGRVGLFASLLPALVGTLGLVLLRYRRAVGAWFLTAYSGFWAVVFLAGLPQVWNVRQSFCLEGLGFCITSLWIARVTVFAVALPFLLSVWWSLQQALVVSGGDAS